LRPRKPAAEPKAHIQGVLAASGSREEIVDVIMQMAVYAGFPVALNCLVAAKEAFAERSQRGKASCQLKGVMLASGAASGP